MIGKILSSFLKHLLFNPHKIFNALIVQSHRLQNQIITILSFNCLCFNQIIKIE